MSTYIEDQPWGTTFYTVLPDSMVEFKTERAKINLFTNPHFGRMLFIDDVLQSTTSDEHIYHNALVSEGLHGFYAGALEGSADVPTKHCREVLIAGGAEGATLRTVQDIDASHELGIEKIVMVDWDRELVQHMIENEPWSRGSFDDERVQLYFEDIHHYIQTSPTLFDTAILDLVDPQTEAEKNWLLALVIKIVRDHTKEHGVVTFNAGSARYAGQMLEELSRVFNYDMNPKNQFHITMKTIHVPSFQEPWFIITIRK